MQSWVPHVGPLRFWQYGPHDESHELHWLFGEHPFTP
jgi:hypothetical protein